MSFCSKLKAPILYLQESAVPSVYHITSVPAARRSEFAEGTKRGDRDTTWNKHSLTNWKEFNLGINYIFKRLVTPG